MPDQNTAQDVAEDLPADWVEIITADGERGHVTAATARHMITYHGARMATGDGPSDTGAGVPDTASATVVGADAWDDDGGHAA